MDKITMLLSYPDDEVGNCLFDPNLIYENKLNPFSDVLNEKEYRFYFKDSTHIFTGVDYSTTDGNGKIYYIYDSDKKYRLDCTMNNEQGIINIICNKQ